MNETQNLMDSMKKGKDIVTTEKKILMQMIQLKGTPLEVPKNQKEKP
jgi:preprotein translocase subunit YajC